MRIGATINGAEQLLLNALANANAATVLHSLRLATGQKISKPAQDPAAYLQITTLQSRLSHADATLANVNTAANIAAQMQLSLDEIRTQLESVRSLLEEDESLELTSDERLEKQAEIDEAILEINRIARADIEGQARLDGSKGFRADGLNLQQVRRLQVFGTVDNVIRGTVTTRAQRATLSYTGTGGAVTANATLTLAGKRGAAAFSFQQSDDLDDVADEINQQSHNTGITAEVAGNTLTFKSVDYGSSATIAVQVSTGTFAVSGGNGDGTAEGVDAVATINDETITGDGNRLSYNRNGLRFQIEFEAGFKGNFSPITVSDRDVDYFAISTRQGDRAALAAPGLQAMQLRGNSGSLDQLLTGGSLAGLSSNTSQAIRVVDEALGQLSLAAGIVDGFAEQTISSSAALLNGYSEAMSDTLTLVNGIDEEEESLLISKSQQMAESALASLSLIAQQRASVVALLQQLAGL